MGDLDTRQAEVILADARALESRGDVQGALDAYHQAFERSGQDAALALDIGRLALRMGQAPAAELLLRIHLDGHPGSADGRLHLAQALREQRRFTEAAAALAPALEAHPHEPALWTALGVILAQEGRPDEAMTFFGEALRLQPGDGGALYHRANLMSDLGEHLLAIADYEAALKGLPEADRDRVRVPLAFSRLGYGNLVRGWQDYAARLSPRSGKPVRFYFPGEPWSFDPDGPPADLAGKRLLLVAEQGLGDEVMFANAVPDVIRALGAGGRLTLAVEPRLVSLFVRSFPTATVIPHRTRTEAGVTTRTADLPEPVDGWATLGAPLRRYRRWSADFPLETGYLKPDPDRVAHWRAVLAARPGRKVGLLWKSLKLEGERAAQFAPFEAWKGILQAPGVSFVNLQYGDCAAELAQAREALGVDILQPPGIDLKQDLDDVAALCCALDLVVGFSNATFNLAGACGAPLWLIAGTGAWTMLGTDRYPWYPQTRVFTARRDGWPPALDEAAEAIAAWSSSGP
jgi:tetratricopeptide (TPR) repeat protein